MTEVKEGSGEWESVSLNREVYIQWCRVGENLPDRSHSQIASALIECYARNHATCVPCECQLCGSHMSWLCQNCFLPGKDQCGRNQRSVLPRLQNLAQSTSGSSLPKRTRARPIRKNVDLGWPSLSEQNDEPKNGKPLKRSQDISIRRSQRKSQPVQILLREGVEEEEMVKEDVTIQLSVASREQDSGCQFPDVPGSSAGKTSEEIFGTVSVIIDLPILTGFAQDKQNSLNLMSDTSKPSFDIADQKTEILCTKRTRKCSSKTHETDEQKSGDHISSPLNTETHNGANDLVQSLNSPSSKQQSCITGLTQRHWSYSSVLAEKHNSSCSEMYASCSSSSLPQAVSAENQSPGSSADVLGVASVKRQGGKLLCEGYISLRPRGDKHSKKQQDLKPKVKTVSHRRVPQSELDCEQSAAAADASNILSAGRVGETAGKRRRGRQSQGSLLCDICGQSFSQASKLRDHKFSHKGYELQCGQCGKACRSKASLAIHLRQKHDENRPFRCPAEGCGKAFATTSMLEQHKRIHGPRNFVCEVCSKTFKFPGVLKTHLRTHDADRTPKYFCPECGIAVLTAGTLKLHTKMLHSETELQKFKCELCDKEYAYSYDFQIHMRKHRGEKTKTCDLCEQTFYSSSDLARHKKYKHPATPNLRFPCGQCKATFTDRVNAMRHIRIMHKKDKRLQCDKCKFSCTFMCELKRHQLVHTEIRPFLCGICGKGFRRNFHLKQHSAIHSSEKLPVPAAKKGIVLETQKTVVTSWTTLTSVTMADKIPGSMEQQ